jgi:hypothetical protein
VQQIVHKVAAGFARHLLALSAAVDDLQLVLVVRNLGENGSHPCDATVRTRVRCVKLALDA